MWGGACGLMRGRGGVAWIAVGRKKDVGQSFIESKIKNVCYIGVYSLLYSLMYSLPPNVLLWLI